LAVPLLSSQTFRQSVLNAGAGHLFEVCDPADLANAMWDLYLKRDRFDEVVGLAGA
jgi:hypothetical protein